MRLIRAYHLCLSLLVGVAGCDSEPAAQSARDLVPIPTGDSVSCEACRVTLTHTGTFPIGDDDTLIGRGAHITLLPGGGAAVAPVEPSGGIARFDSAGRIDRSGSRRGNGPGELDDVFGLTPFGDSLLVYTRSRILLFSPELTLIREAPVAPTAWAVRALANGLFAATSMGDGSGAATLHILGPDLRLRRSFGRALTDGAVDRRALAASPDGDLWASVPGRYRIEQWDTAGRELGAVERTTELFRPWTRREAFNRNRFTLPPLPRVIDLQLRDADLWVLLDVANADWEARAGPGEGGGMPSLALVDSLHDHVLAVLDQGTGIAKASVRLPFLALSFGQPDRLLSVREDSDGIPRFDIWRVSVVDPRPERRDASAHARPRTETR